jgi:hypothetical protein
MEKAGVSNPGEDKKTKPIFFYPDLFDIMQGFL